MCHGRIADKSVVYLQSVSYNTVVLRDLPGLLLIVGASYLIIYRVCVDTDILRHNFNDMTCPVWFKTNTCRVHITQQHVDGYRLMRTDLVVMIKF